MSRRPANAAAASRKLSRERLEEALGFRLRMLEQQVMRNFSLHMAPLEISPTLYSILVLIEANPECRQSDLALALGMHQPNLVERVGVLMSRGLVEREEVAGDRRALALKLTFAGRHFMDKLHAAHADHLADLRTRLGAGRYDLLLDTLGAIEADGTMNG